jgi:hypothetical protein
MISAQIEAAILKCLEKNPAKRFQSVEKLEAALTGQAEEKTVVTDGAEVAMPARLAFWQRSDWYLLGSAVLGVILFFPLFYLFHPESGMEVTVNAEQARQIAAQAAKKLGWDAEAGGRPVLFFNPRDYYGTASVLGAFAFLRNPQDYPVEIGTWLSLPPRRGGPAPGVSFGINLRGGIQGISRLRPLGGLRTTKLGPAPDESAMGQMEPLAQKAVATMFGQGALKGEPSQQAAWGTGGWDGLFRWKVKAASGGLPEVFDAWVHGQSVSRVGKDIFSALSLIHVRTGAYEVPHRDVALAPLLAIFLLGLFLARRIFRQPRCVANLWVAALMGSGLATAWTAVPPPSSSYGPGGTVLKLISPLLFFCVAFLFLYAVLQTLLYYVRTRFPEQVGSFLSLFREHVFARGSGLAFLRGLLGGLVFSGGWMVVVSLSGLRGNALPGVIWWLSLLSEASGVGGPNLLGARIFPIMLAGEVLLAAWLLVAFPLSLLARVTRNSRVLLAALAAFWMALGFSLAGAAVFPTLPYYIFVALQAVFFGAVFLRYDLLTTLSAVFTVEICLLVFPFVVIFQHIDPLPYLIPIGAWFMLPAVAASLYFRPQLVASYRRLAAVFE